MALSPPQRAIITGGAAGIGAVVTETLLRQGARVAILDPDATALGPWSSVPGVVALPVDVADPEAVAEAVPPLLSEWGGIDLLVNNAGIAGPVALAEHADFDEWRRCLDVGLASHFLMSQQVIPLMKAQQDGCIVSIGSTSGQYGVGLRTAYAAAKAGLIGLVKSLAIELGPHSVRVNAVCPGSVRGPRIERVTAAEAAQRGIAAAEVEAEYVAGQSIARLVEPQEVADLVVFLSSSEARMISGQAIAVDGHTETFHLPTRADSQY